MSWTPEGTEKKGVLLLSKPGDRPQLGLNFLELSSSCFVVYPQANMASWKITIFSHRIIYKEGLSTENGGWSQGFTPQGQGYEKPTNKTGNREIHQAKAGEIKLLEWRCLVTFPPFQAVALLIFGGSSIENQKEHGNLNHNYLWWWWICSSFLTPLNLYSYDWDLCISESCGRETWSILWGLTVVPQNFGDAHKKSKEEPCIIGGWGTHSGWFSAIN